MKVVVDPTSSCSPSKDVEKMVDIKTIQDSRKNLALANAIAESEDGREETIPSNVGKLKLIDNDEESDKDLGEIGLKKLMEQKRMRNKIKCFCHISLTSKHF